MDQIPMTPRGAELLRKELQRLTSVERPRISRAIAEARSQGDLSENAEYDAAKEEQGLCESRIKDIEAKLSSAHVIDVTKLSKQSPAKVVFGATVSLTDTDTGKSVTYRIVGEDEADLQAGLISYKAPIARGVMGKEVGEEAEVVVPKGTIYYEITKIEYLP